MFKENKVMEAGEELFKNNPMSAICAVVCNHEMQCAGNCVLGRKGSPVHFSSIEHYISDTYLDRMNISKVEKKDKIGGIMQYGIPEFRLPKSILDRYKKKMLEMGIQIRPNTTIGTVLKIDDLLRDGYASVFVGTGVWKARNLGIHGECLGNVHFGIDYLANVKAYNLGEKVAIIGMGNAAMDVARTVLRNGAQKVTLYARGNTVTASSHEMSYAQLDGAEFVFGKEIQRITEKGLLVVDKNGMTTKKGVFAAGDVVLGSKTVVHAVEGAKRAAESMICYMKNLKDDNC